MSKTLSKTAVGWLYAFVHFSVEVACFSFLFSHLHEHPLWSFLALTFDALAFLPQSVCGFLLDRHPKLPFGVIGCGLLALGLILPWSTVALIPIGIGNALVHISGAQKTLSSTNGRIAPCGIFVGGGSFGVIVGQLLGATHSFASVWIPLVLILLSVAAIVWVTYCDTTPFGVSGISVAADHADGWIVLLTVLVVAARAYIGYAIPTDWNKTATQAVLLFSCMGLGKMLGGILADRIGYRKTGIGSLLLALPFLLFGNSHMAVSLIGVGLFSMTMSITIAVLVSIFQKYPCFSFGITTVALFLGTLPAFFVLPNSLFSHQVTVGILTILAAVSLHFTLKKGC